VATSGERATPADIADRLARATPRVVMLDVDGTLAPIASRPEAAVVPLETRRAIAALTTRPHVGVALVSGRSAKDARRMVAVENLWIAGNHGLELMAPDGSIEVPPEVLPFGEIIARVARNLAPKIRGIRGVQLEDKRWTLSVHYRQADQGIVPLITGAVERVAREAGLQTTRGKEVIEIRPPVRLDKGTAVLALARRAGGFEPSARVMYVGDDRTDEDAFRALRARLSSAVTVRVAHDQEETAAEFRLSSPDEVREMLELLLALP
jgi:trehalose-phosphatase